MKFIKTFEDWNEVSPELKAHIEEGLDLTNSFFRLGSDAYTELFEEVKQYFDWLIRNGQNYFQFFLLESIKEKKWMDYYKNME